MAVSEDWLKISFYPYKKWSVISNRSISARISLNSQEGIVFMGIAKALVRIPYRATQDLFYRKNWPMLTGKNIYSIAFTFGQFIDSGSVIDQSIWRLCLIPWKALISSLWKAIIAYGCAINPICLKEVMQYMAEQFVFADAIQLAVKRCKKQLIAILLICWAKRIWLRMMLNVIFCPNFLRLQHSLNTSTRSFESAEHDNVCHFQGQK